MSDSHRPAAGPPRDYRFPEIARATLSNGATLAVARMPRLPLVTLLALVDAGAANDAAGAEGLASLTARALTEGTTDRDGATLALDVERLGSGLDASSDWDDVLVDLTVTPARLDQAFALLGEVLMTPAFAVRDVERLRAERLAELLQQQVEPRSLADDKFNEILYTAGSRYAVPADGSSATVVRLDADAVRAFHRARYVPGALTLVVVGDVTIERAHALAESAIGPWRGVASPLPALEDRARDGGRRVHVVRKADAPQTELRVGHRGVPRGHADYFPIVVMNALLGGLFSSRINLNLRERNAFTYGANSRFEWRRGAGPFVVSTAVKTDVTAAATREILAEIGAMREGPVSPDELTLATSYLDGVFPIRYETTQSVAHAIAIARTFGLPDDYYTSYREHVRSVTPEDVWRAAKQYLDPERLLVVAVGDADAVAGPLETLGIGTVHVEEAET
ncbi:MAG: insulinase family protein [Gemmatimonadetes bacterium]|nr:insulinase family protein [Gemmatimonadota bacterium]MBI3504540.1 insulinase family protein [Pseudomonadota bacterium]